MASNEKQVKYLAIGEFGCGTKVYEPLATDGLAFFIEQTDAGKNLDMILINGGIVPYIPTELTEQNKREMSFVGDDPLKEEINVEAQELASKMKGPKLDKYIKQNIEKKIISLEDALNVARREICKLLVAVPDVNIHYIHGEEDVKHISDLEKILVKASFDKEHFEKRTQTLEQKTEKSEATYKKAQIECDLLRSLNNYLRGNDVSEDNVKTFLKEQSVLLKQLSREAQTSFTNYINGLIGKPEKSISDKLNALSNDVDKYKKKYESDSRQLQEAETRLSEVKNKIRNMGITKFTGRYSATTTQREMFFYLAKTHYQTALSSIDEKGRFIPHAKFQKEINDKQLKNPAKKNYSELATEENINGLRFLLFHNVNFRSDNISKKSIPKLQEYNNQRYAFNIPQGDILIAAHGGTGFEHMPSPKHREATLEGDVIVSNEIIDYLHLPTFHDPKKLQKLCWENRIRNWHTKRWDDGIFASGAVVHTRYKDGRNVVEFIPFEQLVEFGKLKQKRDELAVQLKSVQDEEKKKKYEDEIRTLEQKVQLNLTKVEYTSDTHIGAPNKPGQLTNYKLVELVQNYQRTTQLPDVLWFGGDNLHGILDRTFNSNGEYLTDVPEKIKQYTEKILNDSSIPDSQKAKLLAELTLSVQSGIPITHMSKQLEQFKWSFEPYLIEVLDNKESSKVVFIAGNHYNGTSRKWDEAHDLSLIVPLKYHKTKQVHFYDDLGADNGSGGLIIGNKTFYAMHHFKKGSSDVLAGAMKHLLKAKMRYDHISFGHWHIPMAGYANGSFITACTTMQTHDKFPDSIGVLPSLRGATNFYYDNNKKYGRWEYLLDPFLEKLAENKS